MFETRNSASPIGGLHESPLPGRAPGLQSRQACCLDPPPLPSVRSLRKLLRLWRALKGFRKLCPGKFRLATGNLGGNSNSDEAVIGHARMDLFVLMAVSTYGCPADILRLRVLSLVRPSPGITRNWSLLMSPEKRPERPKTGRLRRVPKPRLTLMTSWSHTLFCLLKDNHPEAPWSGHHSVPDPSFRTFHRSSTWIPKSGRSPKEGSMEGLEVSGSLREIGSASGNNGKENLPMTLQTHCRLCEESVGEIMLGSKKGPVYGSAGSGKDM